MAIKVAIGKDSTRKLGSRNSSTWKAATTGRPDSATRRTSSNTTPTDRETVVKAATPNSRGPSNSPASQRSIRGKRVHWRWTWPGSRRSASTMDSKTSKWGGWGEWMAGRPALTWPDPA